MINNAKNRPLISIIVAVFNAEKTLQRCIDSVANQTYANKELIIIDGGSTDGTVNILKMNTSKITYWESKPDRGIAHAWNKALKHTTGEWIYFLGADDYLWNHEVLSTVAATLRELYPKFSVVYGQIAMLNSSEQVLETLGESWQITQKTFKKHMCIPHQALFHHRSLFDIHGNFNETYRITSDYDFLLRELKHSDAYFMHNIIVAGMLSGGLSWKLETAMTVLKEFIRARRENHINGIPFSLWWAMLKVFFKQKMMLVVSERAVDRMVHLYRFITFRFLRK